MRQIKNVLEELKSLFYIMEDEGYDVGLRKGPDIGEKFIYQLWLKSIYSDDPNWTWKDEQIEGRKLLKKEFYKEFYDRVQEVCNRYGFKVHLQTIPFNPETGEVITRGYSEHTLPPSKSPFRILINRV